MKTELLNTEIAAPREKNAGLGSYEPLVITLSSSDKYMTLFYVCFCLKIP